jgi:hypothetical protein
MSIRNINSKFNLINDRIKYGTDGGINVNAGTLVVDASNNRVGIGTNNPSFQLSVVGTTSIQHSTSINFNPALDISSDLSGSNVSTLRIISPDRIQDVSNILQGGQGQIGIFSSNSFADISVNHGGGIVMGGNDGSTPYRTFGGIFARKENNTSGNRQGYLQFLTRDGGLSTGGTNNLREKMRITSDGNVGIGTSTPNNKLDIINTNTTTTSVSLAGNGAVVYAAKRYSTNSTGPRYESLKARGTIASPSIVVNSDEIGSLNFYSYNGVGADSGNTGYVRNAIILSQVRDVSGTTITPNLAFGLGTDSANNQYRLVIYNGGEVTIGKGTTSPQGSAILELESTTKGLLPPRMTATQANAIVSPAEGLMVYVNNATPPSGDITSTGWWGRTSTNWVKLN